eukprot:5247731-Pleurochrysis_carterae.AAC.1
MGASGPLRLTSSQEELLPYHTIPYRNIIKENAAGGGQRPPTHKTGEPTTKVPAPENAQAVPKSAPTQDGDLGINQTGRRAPANKMTYITARTRNKIWDTTAMRKPGS